MKLFHTSDWHLGRMLYGRSLVEDQEYFLNSVFLPAVDAEQPDGILLAGDLYDRQVPSTEAIRLFDRALSQLARRNVPIVMISGNHDGGERIAILKDLLRKSGVFLATSLEDGFSPVCLEQGAERVQIFPLPYFDPAQAREFLREDSLRGMNASMEALINRMIPLFEPDCAHILMAHCFAAGSFASDSESTIFVGGSGEVSPALFNPFDYVALGHLHGPQKAGERGRYSGSPLTYSVDEENQRKCFLILDIQDGAVRAREYPVLPLRRVRRVSGSFQELYEEEGICEDYVEITLTDREPVLQAVERLRPRFPNLLSLRNPWTANQGQRRAQEIRNKDEQTIFTSFLKNVCGWEPDVQDLELFAEILEEVKRS